jgi:hypothetical protein
MASESFIGILPKWEWEELNPTPSQAALELRFCELKRAMRRFFNAGTPIPSTWQEEIKSLYKIVGDIDIEYEP